MRLQTIWQNIQQRKKTMGNESAKDFFFLSGAAFLFFVFRLNRINYFMDSIMVKNTAFIFLVLASLACGAQLPTAPSYNGENPSSDVSLPVKVATSAEPTESAPVYVTTAPLNVRAEANADSTILGTLEAGTVVTVFILDIRGDDCYTGEWLAIDKPIAGYVCSLYVQEKK